MSFETSCSRGLLHCMRRQLAHCGVRLSSGFGEVRTEPAHLDHGKPLL